MSLNEIIGYLSILSAVVIALCFWFEPSLFKLKKFFGIENGVFLFIALVFFVLSVSVWIYVLFSIFFNITVSSILVSILEVASFIYVVIFLCWWILNILGIFERDKILLKVNFYLSFFVRMIPLLVVSGFFLSSWIVMIIKGIRWIINLVS